jgi:hypothetical protein
VSAGGDFKTCCAYTSSMALFALFSLGFMVGVWMACIVFRQPQHAYEQAAASPTAGVVVLPIPLHAELTRP